MAKNKLPEGYKGVEKLIKEFRAKNPKGKIETSPVVLADGYVLVTATITTDDGAVGSGMAQADVQEEKSVQKAESGAIRRALLTLGFESEEADESEEKEEKSEREEKRSSFKRDDKKDDDDDQDEESEEDEKEEKPRSRFGNKGSSKDSKKDDRRDSDEESEDDEQEEGQSRFKRGSRFERK